MGLILGLYLTDITFCREGNPATRPSPLDKDRTLINFMKYHRLARIIQGKLVSFSLNRKIADWYSFRYAKIPKDTLSSLAIA